MLAADLINIFTYPLSKENIPYMISGSIGSIYYSEPRLTNDIDMILFLEANHSEMFQNLYPSTEFYCPPEEIIKIEMNRHRSGHFNIIHHKSGFKADCYPHTGDPLEIWGFERKIKIDLDNTNFIYIAPPEYIILKKLQFFREGGSQKHIYDIQGILKFSREKIQFPDLENWIKTLDLENCWKKVEPGV